MSLVRIQPGALSNFPEKTVAFLGDNPDRKQWANFGVKPEDQRTGIFTAPHGIAFAKNGDLYVEDWNVTGRVTKLRRK